METIDYPKRSDMVAALVDARKQGVAVEVVGNGRTLRFPNGIDGLTVEADLAPEEDDDTLLGVVESTEEQVEDEEEQPATEAEEEQAEEEQAEDDDLIGEAPTPTRTSRKRKK